jgi:hypothetical protein
MTIANKTTYEICTHTSETHHAELHQFPFDPAIQRGPHPAKPRIALLQPRAALRD